MLADPMSPLAVTHEVNVVPMNFRKDFSPVPGQPGEFKEIHKVDLVKRGSGNGESTPWKISALELDQILWPAIKPFYERWLEGQEDPVDGTPLDVCPFVHPNLIDHLRALHIKTVEDIAALTDADLERVGMGARLLREKARAYVDAKEGDAQLAEVNAALKAENEQQQAQIDELMSQVNTLMAANGPEKPRRGRPPKAKAA